MKNFKKVFVSILIFSFLFLNVSQTKRVEAGNDTFPVELAIPNEPLIQGEETDFFIIVNDEKIKERITYFDLYLHGNDKAPERIDYNGESYIKHRVKMPSMTFGGKTSIKLEAFSDKEEKRIFQVFKTAHYDLKYPIGSLPSILNAGAEDSRSKEHFRFSDVKAEEVWGVDKGMGYNDPNYSINFNATFEKNMSKNDIAGRIKKDKGNGKRSVTSTYLQDYTPKIEEYNFEPQDKLIEGINVQTFSSANTGTPDRVFYNCYAYVYITVKVDDREDRVNLYPFEFRKYGKNISSETYQTQIDEFESMVRDFAKSIRLIDFPEREMEEFKQKISVSSNMNRNPAFKEYDLDNLSHSGLYNEIMAGNEPGVEVSEKKKKEMEDREFKIGFKHNNESTIWNSGVVNTGTDKDTSFSISVNIDGKAFDKDKEEIEVSDEELYKDVFLMYEIINPKSQIYFQESDIGKNKLKVQVDDVFESQYLQSIGPVLYTGPYLPTEYVSVSLVDEKDNPISKRFIYKVHMKDASPRIEMEKNIVEIDDEADSVFKFKINDEYHDEVKCFVKVPYEKYQASKVPYVKVSEEGQGETAVQILPFDCETNKWISIRVQPPRLSNFNMLSELNGLNMWDLQRGTMETLALDLVAFAVDRRMASLGKSKRALSGLYEKGYTGAKGALAKADKIEKTIRQLDRANGLAGDAQNAIKLTQMGKNIDSHVKDLKNASGVENLTDILGSNSSMAEGGANIVEATAADMKKTEGSGGKTTLEAGYEWGIAGINILQSTVGAVAMAPGHIPFVGKYATKVTGTFSLVFNLMTNVWKGNLEYLSKEKKLDRAQEKKIPYPIMVGATTDEGFRDADVQMVNVLYNYLEK